MEGLIIVGGRLEKSKDLCFNLYKTLSAFLKPELGIRRRAH